MKEAGAVNHMPLVLPMYEVEYGGRPIVAVVTLDD
jgi:hypothetical protein